MVLKMHALVLLSSCQSRAVLYRSRHVDHLLESCSAEVGTKAAQNTKLTIIIFLKCYSLLYHDYDYYCIMAKI